MLQTLLILACGGVFIQSSMDLEDEVDKLSGRATGVGGLLDIIRCILCFRTTSESDSRHSWSISRSKFVINSRLALKTEKIICLFV